MVHNVINKYSNDMEEKILEILKDNKEWNVSLEHTAKELLNLFSVSSSLDDDWNSEEDEHWNEYEDPNVIND